MNLALSLSFIFFYCCYVFLSKTKFIISIREGPHCYPCLYVQGNKEYIDDDNEKEEKVEEEEEDVSLRISGYIPTPPPESGSVLSTKETRFSSLSSMSF